ncbi:MAG: BamA/TamA family outer membrane protein [Pseudomonadota bacterium]
MNARALIMSLFMMAFGGLASTPAVSSDNSRQERFEKFEREGLVIRNIDVSRLPIFDTTQPKEDRGLYRAANRIHIVTRESVVRAQLLFAESEHVSAQAIEESERVLRRNSYIYDVVIDATQVSDTEIDIRVETRDNWTLFPQLGFSQQGGQTEYLLGVQEGNLLGTGGELAFSVEDDGDRESTLLRYGNRNFRGTWWRFEIGYRDSDDGDAQRLRLIRPFFSLDSRWSAGIDATAIEQEEPLFSRGDEVAEYRRDQTRVSLWYGKSRGLVDDWSRRWMVGFAIADDQFDPVPQLNRLTVQPEDRQLRYPFFRYEAIEDRFVTATNLTRMAVTEDLFLGTRYSATVGWFGKTLGADRDGAIFDLDASSSAGDPTRYIFTWNLGAAGRIEGGDLRNGRFEMRAGFVRRQSERRSWFAGIESTVSHEADLDRPVQLGGLSGLRGFDRAFANGDARAVLTLEQRLITNWYPFSLFRVGGAAFVDAGRVWGSDLTGFREDRDLVNVGLGLRLMSTRASSNRMLHIDFAVPLTSGDDIDGGLQISLQGKRGF